MENLENSGFAQPKQDAETETVLAEKNREQTEERTFEQEISERLNSERFKEQINQFPPKERQAVIGIAIEYNVLHRDGFGFEEAMDMLMEESKKVKSFDYMGNKEDASAAIYIHSVSKRLGLSEPFSEDDERSIFEFIAENVYREGFAYHSFNGCFEKSILENGLNGAVVPWDQSELDEVVDIGEKHGHPMILGWHKIQKNGSTYFDTHPYNVYRYGIASPEWFAQFTAEGFHVPPEGNKKTAFYRRDYEAARANIVNACLEMKSHKQEDIDARKAYPNISDEEEEKILNLFEKYWPIVCGPESTPKVALIKKSSLEDIREMTYDTEKARQERHHRDWVDKIWDRKGEPFVFSFEELIRSLVSMNSYHGNDQKTKEVIPGDSLRIVDLPEYKDVYPEKMEA